MAETHHTEGTYQQLILDEPCAVEAAVEELCCCPAPRARIKTSAQPQLWLPGRHSILLTLHACSRHSPSALVINDKAGPSYFQTQWAHSDAEESRENEWEGPLRGEVMANLGSRRQEGLR